MGASAIRIDTQTSLATHIDKVRWLETVFAEHNAIKHKVGVLHQLVEKNTARDLEDEEFGAAGGSGLSDDDDARSIRTIGFHELERVEEEDEDQITKQEQQLQDEDEGGRRRRRVELGRPRTPEPMSLGITYSLDEEDMAPSSSPRQSVIDEPFQRLATLSTQLESAIELSSSLQAQHATAQSTISVLESKVSSRITCSTIVKGGCHASSSGRGGLVTPLSPRSLSADLNRLRQAETDKLSRGRGRSTSIQVIDRGAESESSTTSFMR